MVVKFEDPDNFLNPIIPGGFPDPSICRVGDVYYICNSSFEYFPGLPIHESTDLVNWRWVGYGLHRKEQVSSAVNLVDVKSEDGIQAPSLRYKDGTFYIITTCVYRPPGTDEGTCTNFIITASDIHGPWSDPHVIEGAPGIDPDIFFDDDGKAWYVGTAAPDKPNYPGEGELYCHELDLGAFKLVGERHHLWRGALHGGVFVEGPHMYKHEGSYYLMAAEGGTGVNHAEVIAISDKVTGPFYPNDRNPILTSRHLSYDNWVHSTGHGDLFQLPDGRWFMVCLGVRAEEGKQGMKRSNMGRETHLVPVRWEREPMEWHSLGPVGERLWPVCAPDTGRVERQSALPLKSMQLHACNTFRDTFESPSLHPEWNFRRVPREGMYVLSPGCLRLNAQPQVIEERASCSLMGIRQRQSEFTFLSKMTFKPVTDGVEAGTSVFQKDDNYVNFVVQLVGGKHRVCVTLKERGKEERALYGDDLAAYQGGITFRIESCNHAYSFSYSLDDGASFTSCAEMAADLLLSYGYTGSYLGLYSTSKGKPSEDYAEYAFVQHSASLRLPARGG
ncbi:xylB [Symbiodinium necroappetens]|uniref:XylB protein n=1 Tax=Symbiodinium necroappetens TaxID=1628268 RepID=A0A813CAH7_9DINO|nr:xylB [Symbiodinium necroappetens]